MSKSDDILYVLEAQARARATCTCAPFPQTCAHTVWLDAWTVANSGFNLSSVRANATSIQKRGGRTRIRYMPIEFFIPLSTDREEAAQLLERAMTQIAARQLEMENGTTELPRAHVAKLRRWHRDGTSCQRKTCALIHTDSKPSRRDARVYRESLTGKCEPCAGSGHYPQSRYDSQLGRSVMLDQQCYSCMGTGVPRA